ncbi:ComEA family DNA-binding protein [Ferrimonas senticii]|uniref:ComEA family DNA-binding protein n=1 Tax=Ferrimonas senticii TaxID=394566 RepID=UPI0004116138|nr:ComEA family DNA-binding protein [Ferrimonas senticii]
MRKAYPFIIACLLAIAVPSLAATANVATTASTKKIEQTAKALAKINVNTASASQLAAGLKGIGEKKAQAIIDYRQKHGKFTNINGLTKVKGIGASLIASNYHLIEL